MKATTKNNLGTAELTASMNGQQAKESFAHRLLSFFHDLDSEFPLSGGETPQELSKNVHYMEHRGVEMLKDANTGFPLSGA